MHSAPSQEVGKLNDVLHLTFSAQGLDNKVRNFSTETLISDYHVTPLIFLDVVLCYIVLHAEFVHRLLITMKFDLSYMTLNFAKSVFKTVLKVGFWKMKDNYLEKLYETNRCLVTYRGNYYDLSV